jgi:hypothetical protein
MHGNQAASESSNNYEVSNMKFPFTGLPGLSPALIDQLQRSRLANEQALIHAEVTAPQIAAPKGERMVTVQAVAVITMVLIALYTGKAHATEIGGIGSDYAASPPKSDDVRENSGNPYADYRGAPYAHIAADRGDQHVRDYRAQALSEDWEWKFQAPCCAYDNLRNYYAQAPSEDWEWKFQAPCCAYDNLRNYYAQTNNPEAMPESEYGRHGRDETIGLATTPTDKSLDRSEGGGVPFAVFKPTRDNWSIASPVDEAGVIATACWKTPAEGTCPELLDESLLAGTMTRPRTVVR